MTSSLVAHVYVTGIYIWSKGFPSMYFILLSVWRTSLAVSYMKHRLSKWKEGRKKERINKKTFRTIELGIAFTLKTHSSLDSSLFLQLLSHRNLAEDILEEKKGSNIVLLQSSEFSLECTGGITQGHSPMSSTIFMNSALVATMACYGTLMGYCAKAVQPCHTFHHLGYQLYK